MATDPTSTSRTTPHAGGAAEGVEAVGHTFEEVDGFIQTALLPHIQDAPLSLVATAFIIILLHSMGPTDITEDEVIAGVKDISAAAVLFVSSLRQPADPKKVN